MPDIQTMVIAIVALLAIGYFSIKYLPSPAPSFGPGGTRKATLEPPMPWPAPPPLPARSTLPPVRRHSPEEIDVWISVFKISVEKGYSAQHSAGEADRAVRQFLERYGTQDDDDLDSSEAE